jgi:hypothetical protein
MATIFNTKIDNEMWTVFLSRHNDIASRGHYRELCDDAIALARGELTEFDDVMEARESQERMLKHDCIRVAGSFQSDAWVEANAIDLYLSGNAKQIHINRLCLAGYL